MPNLARPFLLPVNAGGQDDSLSSVASDDSGLSVPASLSSSSSIRSNSSTISSRSVTGDNTIGNSSASSSNSATGDSNDIGNGSASINSSAATPHSRGQMDASHTHPPRYPHGRQRDVQLRDRMQTRAVPVRHHPRPQPRQQVSPPQAIEENPKTVWMTILVSALLIGAFFLFPGARRGLA